MQPYNIIGDLTLETINKLIKEGECMVFNYPEISMIWN
jgi:hypothetical protein